MSLRRTLGILVTVVVMAGALVTGGAGSVSATADSHLTRYPYLTDLVGTKVTVNWATTRFFSTGSRGWVTWGPPGQCAAHTSALAVRTNLAIGPTATQVAEYQWRATIDVGVPGTYCYRVVLANSANPATTVDLLSTDASPSFTSQVPVGSNAAYSFAVLGDWGEVDSNGANPDEANVLARIASSGARFAISTGDNAYNSGTQEEYGDLQQTIIPANPAAIPPTPQVGMSEVFGPSFWTVPGRSIPMFAAIGNHGLVSNDSNGHPHLVNWPQPTAVQSSNGSYHMDTYGPTKYGTATSNLPSLWYAFNAGNTRFYVLQTAWPDNNWGTANGYANDYETHWKPGAAEYQWLKNDLAAHPGGLKFAIFHKPLQSDTSSVNERSDPYLRSDTPEGGGATSLETLLARNGVAIAFNGHAHLYERNSPHAGDSLVSYVTGGGGGQPESLSGSLSGCSAQDEYAISFGSGTGTGRACGSAPVPSDPSQVFHFLKVTVNGTHVTVTPTDEHGNTFDVQTYDFGPQYTQLVGGTASTLEGNSGTHALNIPVTLTKANPTDAVSVHYALSGTAVAGSDYTGNTSGTVTIPAGQTTGFVTVAVKGNTVKQANRTIVATLSNAQHAGIGGLGFAAATIVDDDGAGTAGPTSGGYVVDGFGALHPITTGSAHQLGATRGGAHWGFDIARGVALLPNHTGGYVLDGFGALHPFAVGNNPMPAATRGGPYWNGWDIAKGVAINPDGRGGYIVDAYGGLHPFAIGGNALPAKPTGASYWNGWNIVRGVTLLHGGGGYTVDGFGGLHPFTVNGRTAPRATGGPYWNGWDIVRGVTTTPDGSAGFVLDGYGGPHGFRVTAAAPGAHIAAYWNGWNIARGVAL